MGKKKYQFFLDEASSARLDALIRRYGWTGGQVVERLLAFYAATQNAVNHLTVDELDEHWGGEPEFDEETGQYEYLPCLVVEDPEGFEAPFAVGIDETIVNLVNMLKQGLTPFDGFNNDEPEGV